MIQRTHVWGCMLAMMVLGASVASGQNYPSKPIRIVTTAAGSGNDSFARLIAQGLSANLGQPVIVDNRAGNGIIPVETVVKASPDGYTLLFTGSSLWIASLLSPTPTYDPEKDLAPITLAVSAPNILAVHPSVPAMTVKELIALAKSRPGKLNYGSGQIGTVNLISAEMFNAMAGVKIMRITYRGTNAGFNALIAGEVDLMFVPAAVVAPHLKSGKLRALAVTSAQPSQIVPDLPPVAASLPGYDSVAKFGLSAPAGTPVAVVNRLNQETVRVINLPENKKRFLSAGTDIVASSPEEYAIAGRTEMARLRKLIKEIGIRVD